MTKTASCSTLAATLCVLGGVPASAGPFEELVAQLFALKTKPRIEMAIHLGKEPPQQFHLLGHNLGDGIGASEVRLRQPERPVQKLVFKWVNSQHLHAALPELIDSKSQQKMAVAVAMVRKDSDGASAAGPVSDWERLPARCIDSPLELIESPRHERIHYQEARDVRAEVEGIGSMRISFELTQGHRNNLVARAFGLSPTQVAERLRQLETKAVAPVVAPF